MMESDTRQPLHLREQAIAVGLLFLAPAAAGLSVALLLPMDEYPRVMLGFGAYGLLLTVAYVRLRQMGERFDDYRKGRRPSFRVRLVGIALLFLSIFLVEHDAVSPAFYFFGVMAGIGIIELAISVVTRDTGIPAPQDQ